MPASAASKFDCFVQDMGLAKHNFSSHVFKLLLSNVAPVRTNTVLANITQIAAANGYPSGGVTLDGVQWLNANGISTLYIADEVLTASGGSVGPFRYAVVYNATTGALMVWYDYGQSITLANNEPFTLDFDPSGVADFS